MKYGLLPLTIGLCVLTLTASGCDILKRRRPVPAPNPSSLDGRLSALESQTSYIQKELGRLDQESRERQRLARRLEAIENQIDLINQQQTSSSVGESPLESLPKPADVGGNLPERSPPPENPLVSPEPAAPRVVQSQGSDQRSISVRERSAEELFRLGARHYEAGELGPAVEKLRLYLVRSPSSQRADEALYLIGRAELGRGRPYAAAVSFRHLVDSFPSSHLRPEALYHGGEAYHRLYDKVLALKFWKELEARYPSNPLAAEARAAIRRMAEER